MNILITGGASGLGEAITRTLAENGTNTIFFTYASSELKAKEIQLDFSNATAIKCDFKNAANVTELVHKIETLNLDVLVNNAYCGSFINTHFHKTPIEDFTQDFINNIIPTIRITQSVIKHFRKKKSGKLITILTSALVSTPPIGASSYVANKAYLKSLVNSWATENIKFNITSNAVSPSFMQTKLTADVDERIVEQMVANHPLKKLLKAEEVAETVDYLTKSSSQINGVDIVVNAGKK